jgi:hypothetical protein
MCSHVSVFEVQWQALIPLKADGPAAVTAAWHGRDAGKGATGRAGTAAH